MEDAAAPPKKSTTLSVDRAAFLLLRVKKAFKKKRQHRKEKQTQLAGAGLASQKNSCRKMPPPLLRSRTLPAIILPGIPVVSLHTDKNPFQFEERPVAKSGNCRWTLLTRTPANTAATGSSSGSGSGGGNYNNNNNNNNTPNIKSLNLPRDDITLVYRRKSSGSTPHSVVVNNGDRNTGVQPQPPPPQQQQYTNVSDASFLQMSDDFECHADGSLLLRIPAPHVVAARAYRLAHKRTAGATEPHPNDGQQPPYSTYEGGSLGAGATTTSAASGSGGSGNTAGGPTNTTLTRLAKLLHQSSITTTKHAHGDYSFHTALMAAPPSGGAGDEAPRRLSWERRKDSSALQRSASIDSFAEIVFSDTPRPSLDIPRPAVPFSKRPSASSLFANCTVTPQSTQLNINYGDMASISNAGCSRRESLLSPSSTRRNKATRIINDNIFPNSFTHDNTSATARSERTTTPPTYYSDDSCVILRNSASSHIHINKDGDDDNNNDDDKIHANTHQRHQTVENHVTRDNNSHSINSSSAFRWSEQLTHNVSVAKIRTAISCTPQDLKEMEFLLPHAPSSAAAPPNATHTTTRSSNSSSKNSSSTTTMDEQQAAKLSVARQARLTNTNHANVTHPKNGRLNNACSDENNAGNAQNSQNAQHLAIHRQPSSARAKGGNTPYRSKMSKKQLKLAQAQLDKLTQINLHLHALFSAVEHGHLDKARTILESTDVDINSINPDGLSALDVAVLSNNRSMTKMLLQHGAVDSSQFGNDSIGCKLQLLLKDAESRIHDLSASEMPGQTAFSSRPSISSIIIGNTGSSVTGCTGNEVDKQIGIWERRVKGLRRLLLGWDQARPPDAPASLTVDVTGENSITMQILEPFDGSIGTKFRVQWSTRADFSNVVGEREISDWTSYGAQCHVGGLTQGRRYFIRATCGNVKGWGAFKSSVPASIVPSTWRDLNNLEDRYLGRQRILDNLFTAVRLARPADVSELTLDTSTAHRRNPKKKTTIKQLFSVASKFQKHLRRGIYLATIVYCEDKVLVTSEDFLPVIEIDETYPSTLHSDYHWLMKIACTWDDVKSLRTDMERNLTSAVHFRTKLLSAVCQMQSALSLTDLGQLYYKPLRDSHGTVVLTCIQAVKSQKTVSILNSRWLPINKLQKKIIALLEDYNINDMLIASIGDQIQYHQSSMQRLDAGLYLGYLKMQCSMEQIQVVVPAKTPNVLPHYKVRDNSHITAEEWQILKRCDGSQEGVINPQLRLPLEFNANSEATTEVQRLFLYDLTTAAHKLFGYMNIKPGDAATHRLYDVEVIEHSKDISFLIIVPSVELTCAVPGQSELLLQRDDLASLSIQAFEMIHLRTYQPGIIQKYARLSCILELDTALANHSHREAFSTSELQTAKERLAKLHELTSTLNAVWKSVRWLMDVIAFARDKNAQSSVAMREILEFAHLSDEMSCSTSKQQLLQLPIADCKFTKSGSGRGSWPGPAGNVRSDSNTCLAVEHSKSEQNLGQSAVTPTSSTSLAPSEQMPTYTKGTQQHLQVSNDFTSSNVSLRKYSGDSITSQYTSRSFYSAVDSAVSSSNELGTIFAIPPSRSDDALTLAQTQSSSSHRKRTSSNITHSTTSSPQIAVHSSSSAPYLSRDAASSSLSLKSGQDSDYEIKLSKTSAQSSDSSAASLGKIKAASSINLRDGGLYLKTTLSALQTEIKASIDEPTVTKASSAKSLSRQNSEEDTASCSSLASEQAAGSSAQSSGIIQVYTAYNTGLASGTSLKLHVTPKTTAREVINLVVKQLNMAAVLKGNNGPIYTADMLDNFCLVAVIGARERCLRDDFKPLQLQNPWKKGRLYVRQKHELLAAIEHSNRKSHLI